MKLNYLLYVWQRLCKCQRDSGAVEIDGIEAAVFRAVLEFVYTAHATMHSMEVLMAANRFELPRLVTLCELYQSKSIETACVESIRYADINVIGILVRSDALWGYSKALYQSTLTDSPL